MNNSTKLKIAHKIAKANHRAGDCYRVTFAASLRWVNNGGYELTGAANEIIITRSFNGSISHKLSVIKCDAAIAAKLDVRKDLGEDYYLVSTQNRAELNQLQVAINNAKSAAVSAGYSSRKIVTLDYAQLMGLSHGKSWYCSERDIELKGACPSFDGQLICYAYTA